MSKDIYEQILQIKLTKQKEKNKMAKVNANQSVELKEGFDVVQEGEYLLKISEYALDKETQESIREYPDGTQYVCFKIEFDDTSVLCYGKDFVPATNPGAMWLNIIISDGEDQWGNQKQAKLRRLVEACGLDWAAFSDTDELINQRFMAKVNVELKDAKTGELLDMPRNVIKRIIGKK